MDSSVALDPRGAGPIFLRPVPRAPPLRGPFARLACGRSRCTSAFVAGLAAPNFSWLAFLYFDVW
jgi:hypothetical protein